MPLTHLCNNTVIVYEGTNVSTSSVPGSPLTLTFPVDASNAISDMRRLDVAAREHAEKLRAEFVIRPFKVNVDPWPKMPREKPRLRRRGQKQRFGR